MLSTKTLFFALIVVALSSFTSLSAAQAPRFMMEDGDHGDCHCDGDDVHCDDPDEEAECHCHDGEAHCDEHDEDSGAFSFSLIGSAVAGIVVAAAL